MTFVPVQIAVALALITTEGTRAGLTVIVTPVLVAVIGVAQVALEVNTTLNASPSAAVVVE